MDEDASSAINRFNAEHQKKKRTSKRLLIILSAGGIFIVAAFVGIFLLIRGVPVDSVSLSQYENTLNIGDTEKLVYYIYPDNATHKEVYFVSSDEYVATVNQSGIITANNPGTCNITIESKNGMIDTCTINVEIPATRIMFSYTEVTAVCGESGWLEYTITPDNTTNTSVVWESSDPSISTVDSLGNITAKKPGVCTITVTTSNGLYDTCTLYVTTPVEQITLSESEIALKEGESSILYCYVLPEDATDQTVIYESSDYNIAYVDEYGEITGYNEGVCTITVTASNGMSDSCIVYVEKSVDLLDIYYTYCNWEWSYVADDESYLAVDTNPNNSYDYIDYDALYAVSTINIALGVPDYVYEDIIYTTSDDGVQYYYADEFYIAWSYDTSYGLEVFYSLY